MKREPKSILVIGVLFLSLFCLGGYIISNNEDVYTSSVTDLDFSLLKKEFDDDIPVVVKFNDEITDSFSSVLLSLGLRFSFGAAQLSAIGSYYLLRGTAESLDALVATGFVSEIMLQTNADHLHSARDVSIPEIDADEVWEHLDRIGENITGKGILIADLDTGVEWQHPDLWFADGGEFDWIDYNGNNILNHGDVVDKDGSGTPTSDEMIGFIDNDQDGTFNSSTDWVWNDLNQNSKVEIGEPIYIVDDANGNDTLDPGEKLVLLQTPKTKYIVERDPVLTTTRVWERGVNLTSSTHVDIDGHGTAVSGILVGGQIGYRKYVGVAPEAELMMIKVLGTAGTYLTLEEGLAFAYNHGADVVLVEVGQWVEVF